jgi:hypothetical protein
MAEFEEDPEFEAQRGLASILNWYDSTRPMFIDLVGDYAGKELFLVEGDSLLRECFQDDRIDFHGGFQILHAVYVVERFLEDLLKRHCNFHIAFFEEHAGLCIPPGELSAKHSARYLLARAVIKRHLTLHLPSSCPNVEVHTFSSIRSDAFHEYLQESPVHFVMVHDGSAHETNIPTNGEDDKDVLPRIKDRRAKTLLRAIIWYFNTHGLNVALINQVEFRDSKVFTMIVESIRSTRRVKQSIKKFAVSVESAKKSLETALASDDSPLDDVLDAEDMTNLEEVFSEEDLSETYLLAVYGVSQLLKEKECDTFLASAFIIHSILLKHLPLSQRRLPLTTFDEEFEETIDDFLASISKVFRNVICNKKWNDLMEAEEVETDAVDLIDGRLFRVVLQALSDDSLHGTIPEVAKPDWEILSGLVALLSDEALSTKASIEPTSSETSAKTSDFTRESEDLAVLPFTNPIFDKHLECIHVNTDDSLVARFGSMKLYRETTHWHNHRKPLNPKAVPVVKVSKWRNPLRTNQFYMKEMTSYAASLTGAKGKILEPETITVGPKQLVKLVEEKPEKSTAKHNKEEQKESKKPKT